MDIEVYRHQVGGHSRLMKPRDENRSNDSLEWAVDGNGGVKCDGDGGGNGFSESSTTSACGKSGSLNIKNINISKVLYKPLIENEMRFYEKIKSTGKESSNAESSPLHILRKFIPKYYGVTEIKVHASFQSADSAPTSTRATSRNLPSSSSSSISPSSSSLSPRLSTWLSSSSSISSLSPSSACTTIPAAQHHHQKLHNRHRHHHHHRHNVSGAQSFTTIPPSTRHFDGCKALSPFTLAVDNLHSSSEEISSPLISSDASSAGKRPVFKESVDGPRDDKSFGAESATPHCQHNACGSSSSCALSAPQAFTTGGGRNDGMHTSECKRDNIDSRHLAGIIIERDSERGSVEVVSRVEKEKLIFEAEVADDTTSCSNEIGDGLFSKSIAIGPKDENESASSCSQSSSTPSPASFLVDKLEINHDLFFPNTQSLTPALRPMSLPYPLPSSISPSKTQSPQSIVATCVNNNECILISHQCARSSIPFSDQHLSGSLERPLLSPVNSFSPTSNSSHMNASIHEGDSHSGGGLDGRSNDRYSGASNVESTSRQITVDKDDSKNAMDHCTSRPQLGSEYIDAYELSKPRVRVDSEDDGQHGHVWNSMSHSSSCVPNPNQCLSPFSTLSYLHNCEAKNRPCIRSVGSPHKLQEKVSPSNRLDASESITGQQSGNTVGLDKVSASSVKSNGCRKSKAVESVCPDAGIRGQLRMDESEDADCQYINANIASHVISEGKIHSNNLASRPVENLGMTESSSVVTGNADAIDADCRCVRHIVLEDLVYGFRKPCVLDIKMGKRQRKMGASAEKEKRQLDKSFRTTSNELGFRLCGCQNYDKKTDTLCYRDKYWGRKLTKEKVPGAIKQWFWNGYTYYTDLLPPLLEKLMMFFDCVSQLRHYRFWSSSLLWVYDGDAADGAERRKTLDIRMIDFANTIYLQDNPAPDEEYLFGVRNLIDALRILLVSADQPSPRSSPIFINMFPSFSTPNMARNHTTLPSLSASPTSGYSSSTHYLPQEIKQEGNHDNRHLVTKAKQKARSNSFLSASPRTSAFPAASTALSPLAVSTINPPLPSPDSLKGHLANGQHKHSRPLTACAILTAKADRNSILDKVPDKNDGVTRALIDTTSVDEATPKASHFETLKRGAPHSLDHDLDLPDQSIISKESSKGCDSTLEIRFDRVRSLKTHPTSAMTYADSESEAILDSAPVTSTNALWDSGSHAQSEIAVNQIFQHALSEGKSGFRDAVVPGEMDFVGLKHWSKAENHKEMEQYRAVADNFEPSRSAHPVSSFDPFTLSDTETSYTFIRKKTQHRDGESQTLSRGRIVVNCGRNGSTIRGRSTTNNGSEEGFVVDSIGHPRQSCSTQPKSGYSTFLGEGIGHASDKSESQVDKEIRGGCDRKNVETRPSFSEMRRAMSTKFDRVEVVRDVLSSPTEKVDELEQGIVPHRRKNDLMHSEAFSEVGRMNGIQSFADVVDERGTNLADYSDSGIQGVLEGVNSLRNAVGAERGLDGAAGPGLDSRYHRNFKLHLHLHRNLQKLLSKPSSLLQRQIKETYSSGVRSKTQIGRGALSDPGPDVLEERRGRAVHTRRSNSMPGVGQPVTSDVSASSPLRSSLDSVSTLFAGMTLSRGQRFLPHSTTSCRIEREDGEGPTQDHHHVVALRNRGRKIKETARGSHLNPDEGQHLSHAYTHIVKQGKCYERVADQMAASAPEYMMKVTTIATPSFISSPVWQAWAARKVLWHGGRECKSEIWDSPRCLIRPQGGVGKENTAIAPLSTGLKRGSGVDHDTPRGSKPDRNKISPPMTDSYVQAPPFSFTSFRRSLSAPVMQRHHQLYQLPIPYCSLLGVGPPHDKSFNIKASTGMAVLRKFYGLSSDSDASFLSDSDSDTSYSNSSGDGNTESSSRECNDIELSNECTDRLHACSRENSGRLVLQSRGEVDEDQVSDTPNTSRRIFPHHAGRYTCDNGMHDAPFKNPIVWTPSSHTTTPRAPMWLEDSRMRWQRKEKARNPPSPSGKLDHGDPSSSLKMKRYAAKVSDANRFTSGQESVCPTCDGKGHTRRRKKKSSPTNPVPLYSDRIAAPVGIGSMRNLCMVERRDDETVSLQSPFDCESHPHDSKNVRPPSTGLVARDTEQLNRSASASRRIHLQDLRRHSISGSSRRGGVSTYSPLSNKMSYREDEQYHSSYRSCTCFDTASTSMFAGSSSVGPRHRSTLGDCTFREANGPPMFLDAKLALRLGVELGLGMCMNRGIPTVGSNVVPPFLLQASQSGWHESLDRARSESQVEPVATDDIPTSMSSLIDWIVQQCHRVVPEIASRRHNSHPSYAARVDHSSDLIGTVDLESADTPSGTLASNCNFTGEIPENRTAASEVSPTMSAAANRLHSRSFDSLVSCLTNDRRESIHSSTSTINPRRTDDNSPGHQ